MIRWYDYIAAIVVADFLLANFILAASGPTLWLQFFGGLFVALLWDLWGGVYCRFRLKMEMKKDE